MPDLVLPCARCLVDPRAAQRRDLQSANREDSSTVIGRRAAARVNVSDNQGSLSSRLSFSQIEQRLQAQTAQVAWELENITERLAASRSRRVELASSRVRGDIAAAAAQDNGTPQVALTTASGDARLVPNPPAGGRPSILQTCLRTLLGILQMHPRCEGHWLIFSRGTGMTNIYPPVMLNTLGPALKLIREMRG